MLYCWGHGISTCGYRRYSTVGDMGLVLVDVGGVGISTCGCRRYSTVGDMGLVLVNVGGTVLLGTWA